MKHVECRLDGLQLLPVDLECLVGGLLKEGDDGILVVEEMLEEAIPGVPARLNVLGRDRSNVVCPQIGCAAACHVVARLLACATFAPGKVNLVSTTLFVWSGTLPDLALGAKALNLRLGVVGDLPLEEFPDLRVVGAPGCDEG
ncbi:hypothetical protein SAMD00019534_096000 [Acytostelium subglobosum LB1]|uniref:hypothetical protein n=1 Tax=Acytostelium subglobosum LB1 TaxID=1410327 RepID=UPI000644A3E5|nr:hypothetical protein SAMD00019534_096000 [Acytostelium subglobosum LB1]GAM26425.1 hypothetical protein SAMD00019534_096000 [Acytostelium subglobosum LB1]|eukprot:XP_012750521.1 hypothetical protein SAMD00019534_096000 [Acytostelium subglobosum LB1]